MFPAVDFVRRARLWLVTSLLLLSFTPVTTHAAATRPNIIFILVDDMGYGDLSCTGNKDVPTPNFDRLAKEGTRFTQFYVDSPICSPSRVAFTTGQYPNRWRVHSYFNSRALNRKRGMADYLDPKAPAIARAFKAAGYATAHFGKWHMGGGRDVDDAPLPQAYGFDESLVSFEGLGDRILPPGNLSKQSAKLGHGSITNVLKCEQSGIYIDRSIDFIKRHQKGPFYLHLMFNDVHDAHEPRADYFKKFERFKANPYKQKFYAVLAQLDDELGRLLKTLDDLKLSEKTLVVMTSDNGPTAWLKYYKQGYQPPGSTAGFRGRKWSLYEGGIHVPLIVRWKGAIPAGRVDETSVIAAVDFFPTFCQIAHVTPPAVAFDGVDMSRAFLGEPQVRTKPIFWRYDRDIRPGDIHDVSPVLAMREGNWKLFANADGSQPELYNMTKNIEESDNLAAQEPERVHKMLKALETWRDTLPPVPAGAVGVPPAQLEK